MVLALEKGRSSDPRILGICRRWASLCLACGVRMRVRWIPSEINVSDHDSRLWSQAKGKRLIAIPSNNCSQHEFSSSDFKSGRPASGRKDEDEATDFGEKCLTLNLFEALGFDKPAIILRLADYVSTPSCSCLEDR